MRAIEWTNTGVIESIRPSYWSWGFSCTSVHTIYRFNDNEFLQMICQGDIHDVILLDDHLIPWGHDQRDWWWDENESQSWRSSWQITIRKLSTTNQSESKRSVISTCKRSLNEVGSWSSNLIFRRSSFVSVGLKLSPKSWLPKLRSEVSDGPSLWKEDFDSLR